MRPHPTPPCRPPAPGPWLAAPGARWLFPLLLPLALLNLAAPAPAARADDTVRRAQEELRKRNLYFGDIDGVPNRGTLGALRRYQERKRLAVTGEADSETLRSLGIPAPHSDAPSAPLDPDPWPDMPVLRSDQARRPPPLAGEVVLAGERPPVTAAASVPAGGAAGGNERGGPPLAMERGTPQMAEANAAATPPERRPTNVSATKMPGDATLDPETARAFIEDYLRDGSTNDLRAEMSYYAEEVDYFNKGPAGRDYIRRDVASYYKRWPERRYEIIGPVSVLPGARPGETNVRFQIRFRCRGRAVAEGRTENLFTLEGARPGEVRIVGMKEQRVRQ